MCVCVCVCVSFFENWMPFKSDQKCFLFNFESSFLFLRYLNFCPDIFGHVRKRLDKKAKVNFKIYGVINWETNNCNSHVAQYLKN